MADSFAVSTNFPLSFGFYPIGLCFLSKWPPDDKQERKKRIAFDRLASLEHVDMILAVGNKDLMNKTGGEMNF